MADARQSLDNPRRSLSPRVSGRHSIRRRSGKLDKKDYDASQQKTFTKWVNTQLKRKSFEGVDDLLACWKNGWKLAELVNALYEVKIPKLKKASKLKFKPQFMDNLVVAMNMLEKDAKVKTNFLKGEHLYDGDKKMILGMVWAIILDHAIKGIKFDNESGTASAKEGLLLWVRKQTKGYRDVDPPEIHNFTTNWMNGMALSALIHKYDPSLIDYDSLDKANAKQNTENAIRVAEEQLGIPAYVEASDLCDSRPDEKVVMTYVAEFFHKFSSVGEKDNAIRRVKRFVEFQRKIWNLKTSYNERAERLIKWAQSKLDEFKSCQLAETAVGSQKQVDELKEYVKSGKPAMAVEKMEIESIFAEIQTSLRVNSRPLFVPKEGLAPEELDSKWQLLQTHEAKYGAALRGHLLGFIRKIEHKATPEQIKEYEDSYAHFDSNNDGTLSKDEFKAALTSLGISMASAEYDKVFLEVSEGLDTISKEAYVRYMKMTHEDRGTAEEVTSSFKALADGKNEISPAQLTCLSDEDKEFLLKHMAAGKSEGHFDFKNLVESSFA